MSRIQLTDESITLFYNSLESLLTSGETLSKALYTISEKSSNKSVVNLAQKCITPSLEVKFVHPEKNLFKNGFFELFYRLQKIDDRNKVLQVLSQLRIDFERRSALRKGVLSKLAYPIQLFSIMLCIVTAMLIWVIPLFAEMFNDLSVPLPQSTRFLIEISYIFKEYSLIIVTLLIAVLGVLYIYGKTIRDTVLSLLPQSKSMMMKLSHSQFFGYAATLTLMGDDLPRAFKSAAEVISNRLLQHKLKQNNSLLLNSKIGIIFADPLIDSIIESADRNNTLSITFENLSLQNVTDVEEMTKSFISSIEQFTVIIIGLIVGSILVALYKPMFSLSSMIM